MPETPGSTDRVSVLEAITDVGLRQMELEESLRVLLARVRDAFGVDTATILLYDSAAERLRVHATAGLEEEVLHGVTVELGAGFAGRVAATRAPLVIDRVDATTVANPLLWRRGLRALLGVPILAREDLVGVLHVGSTGTRAFTEADTHLLRLVADRVALAIQAELTSAERAATTALQRSLLPTRFPVVDDLRFAARYVPGATTGVGGDWYDVFELPSGRIGVAIGDVSGHGLAAAVVMGRLRSALRAYALENDDPAEVLTKLHRKVSHFEKRSMATVAYAVVDRRTRRVALSSAGHPPPVIAVPGAASALVDVPPDTPVGLGLGAGRARRTTVIDLPDRAVLAFYTDGLVERRREPIDPYLDRLTEAVTPQDPDTVCAQVMEALVGTDPTQDDIALLVMRACPV
ncbi:PP2C family protein-serine/threonine phosphatase [Actinokineospora terrae]|uniref:Serine phosphatase RsbU, regulator of sigma subunit n=1 Tax=Actinokineospora terrae TaxID=155974 RepID=A0A1H9LI10_9PSEU|nr:GAF domain-containing SpoIIE family protein phosphatase [Actinokineospora terrae]SER11066.1 Serine phosphatase RsbU, regulator of sigma subunit [Actinokineospora terrae]